MHHQLLKLQQGKERMRRRFAQAAEILVKEAGVREWHQTRKSLTGRT